MPGGQGCRAARHQRLHLATSECSWPHGRVSLSDSGVIVKNTPIYLLKRRSCTLRFFPAVCSPIKTYFLQRSRLQPSALHRISHHEEPHPSGCGPFVCHQQCGGSLYLQPGRPCWSDRWSVRGGQTQQQHELSSDGYMTRLARCSSV